MARPRREESRERTRERLLEAGRAVVARQGFEGASIAAISEAAGFTKGAFFSNFGSKEALLLELLSRHKRQEIDSLSDLMGGAETDGRPPAGVEDYLARLDRDRDWARLDIEMQLHAARHEDFARDYDALQKESRARLGRLIGSVFAARSASPPLPPEELGDLMKALVQGLALQRRPDPGRYVKLMFERLLGDGGAADGSVSTTPKAR